MYIRQTRTASSSSGEAYITYRLVRGIRTGGKVRQVTLLNLGRNFDIPKEDWPTLCARIDQLTMAQPELPLSVLLPVSLEKAAQMYAKRLIELGVLKEHPVSVPTQPKEFTEVDVDSLELSYPRSVGVEHVGMHAFKQLGLDEKLAELGINGVMRAAILASIIGRMAKPASEHATWNWLCTQSALGDLMHMDFSTLSPMRLYRASDLLIKNREAIETHLFERASHLFSLTSTVTLYDLTNTYFEGDCAEAPKAKRGHSKEKRTDCPLVTLGMVLDGSGFVRRSRMFEGNAVESHTLEEMLQGLHAPEKALVIMDAGIATEANIAWLSTNGYRYLVVSRERTRHMDTERAVETHNSHGQPVRLQKVLSDDGKEVRLYCYSEARAQKEVAIVDRFVQRYEAGLQKLVDGLSKPRGEKRLEQINRRIGRLNERCHGVAQHYCLHLAADEQGTLCTGITWEKTMKPNSMATHPGVYCLRSNETGWDEHTLWHTYTMLTDLEAVFRSLKSELGLRPVYHHKEDRIDGHLFITVLAYQLVQIIRRQLNQAGIRGSWSQLRNTLEVQRRVTTSFVQRDGRTMHVRKSTRAEPDLLAIYNALGLNASPGGTVKSVF